jgi:hypothetical protein
MLMRYRGGGVGHTNIRDATDWFLKDRDKLDMASEQARYEKTPSKSMSADEGSEEDDEQDDDNEAEEGDGDEGAGGWVTVGEVEDIDEDEIDEELDYGYALDEEVAEESEEECHSDDELIDNALGAEDGEEAEDELDNLGFGTL